jgi:hypothetical protein
MFSHWTKNAMETTLPTPLKPLFRRYAGRVFAGLLAGAVSAGAFANGQFETVSGDVRVGPARATAKEVAKGDRALEGQTVFTGASGRALLRFEDGQVLVLNPNTEVKITAYRFDRKQPGGDKVSFDLLRGALRAVTGLIGSRNPTAFSMRTPTATIGIRGTDFTVAGLETADTAELINLADAGTVMSDAGGGLPPMMLAQASAIAFYLKVTKGFVWARNTISDMVFTPTKPFAKLAPGKPITSVLPNQLPSAIEATFSELGGVTVSATTTGGTTAATNTGGAGGATGGAGGAVGGATGAVTGVAVGAAAGIAGGIAGAAGDTTTGSTGTTGTTGTGP